MILLSGAIFTIISCGSSWWVTAWCRERSGVRQVIHCVSSAGHRLGGRRPDIEGSSRQNLVSTLRQVSEGALVVWSNDRCHLEEYGQCLDGHSSFALATKPHQEALMVKSRHTDRSVSTSSLQQPERSRQAGHGQSRY
ncbi:hypothetical protein RRG08_050568 [Elysia crispata]|uniref:Secreted protein n=1 Tax=Elysia crispata TaxID=231223 RepID=A0AAE1DBK5_9GAST|nr:hypothetical protein RRG08_050568 [Elysia crispata]